MEFTVEEFLKETLDIDNVTRNSKDNTRVKKYLAMQDHFKVKWGMEKFLDFNRDHNKRYK